MTKNESYNGWTNRETWAVALWINNEQGMQEQLHEQIREEWTAGRISADQTRKVGELVEEYLHELFDLDNYGVGEYPRELQVMREDIGSMWRVDWSEIGASFLRDALEDAPDAL